MHMTVFLQLYTFIIIIINGNNNNTTGYMLRDVTVMKYNKIKI